MGLCVSKHGEDKSNEQKLEDMELEKAGKPTGPKFLEETEEFAKFLAGLPIVKSSNLDVEV